MARDKARKHSAHFPLKTAQGALTNIPAPTAAKTADGGAPRVLADCHDAYRITLHQASGEQRHSDLVITFAGQPGDIACAGFGTDFALSQGYDTIYVAQKNETHFQELSAEDFAKAVAPHAEDRRVVAYGSSLGGYAALYFGGAIGADIVAAAPLLPPWPSLRNPRYRNFTLRHPPLTNSARTAGRVTILFDPEQRADQIFLDEAVRPAYPGADYVALRHAGHTVLKTLARVGMVSDVIAPLLRGEACPEISLPTEGFEPWHLSVGGASLVAGDFAAAERHGRAALRTAVTASAVSIVTRALARAGQEVELIDFLSNELTPEQRERFVSRVAPLRRIVVELVPDLGDLLEG